MKRLLLFLLIFPAAMLVFSQTVEISAEKALIDGKKYYLHTVKQGQTLYAISKAYSVSVDEMVKSNPEAENGVKTGQVLKIPILGDVITKPVNQPPTPDPKIEGIEHIVQRGETVYGICRMYHLSVEALYEANPIIQERGLRPGDILIITESDVKETQPVQIVKPVQTVQPMQEPNDTIDTSDDNIEYSIHEVKKGETFYSIAKQYKVSESDILNSNQGLNPSKLRTGQKIQIPRFADPKTQLPKYETDVDTAPTDTESEIKTPELQNDVDYSPKSELNMVIMLPFDIYSNTKNWYNQESAKKEFSTLPLNEMMLAYYSGCLMAFDSLKNNGFKLNVNVYDTGADTVLLSALFDRNELKNADIIIGPVYTKQLQFIRDRISEKTILISPFSDYEKVNMEMKSVIWSNPGKVGRFGAISNYAALNPQYRYIIVYNNNDISRGEALSLKDNMIKNSTKLNSHDSLFVAVISYSEASGSALSALMSQSTLNVVICEDKSEAQVSSIMAKLIQIKKTDICLLGEMSWLDYRSIDASYFNTLKFSFTAPYWVDYSSPAVKNFIYKYREIFVAEPLAYSFAAYDQMLYLLNNYKKYGTDLLKYPHMPVHHNQLATNIEFVNIDGSRQFIQKHCNILSLDEGFNTICIYPVKQ